MLFDVRGLVIEKNISLGSMLEMRAFFAPDYSLKYNFAGDDESVLPVNPNDAKLLLDKVFLKQTKEPLPQEPPAAISILGLEGQVSGYVGIAPDGSGRVYVYNIQRINEDKAFMGVYEFADEGSRQKAADVLALIEEAKEPAVEEIVAPANDI